MNHHTNVYAKGEIPITGHTIVIRSDEKNTSARIALPSRDGHDLFLDGACPNRAQIKK